MKMLFVIGILIVCSCAWSQSYSFQGNSPFNVSITNGMDENQTLKLLFADLDKDGDLDVLHVGVSSIDDVDDPKEENIHYFFDKQINIGTKSSPLFTSRETYNSNFTFPQGYFLPAPGDLNHDGQLDFFISAEMDTTGNQQALYYRNMGSSISPEFQVIKSLEFDLDEFLPGSLFYPELIDLDRDGDLDLLMSGHERQYVDTIYEPFYTYKYAKNIGTPTIPEFLGWFEEPFNLKTHGIGELFLTGGDIDLDGDMDVLGVLVDSASHLYYYENTALPNAKPFFSFPQLSPFGMPTANENEQLLFPTLVDMDGDTDLDLFVMRLLDGEIFELEYYENDLASDVVTPESDNVVTVYPQPAKDILFIQSNTNEDIETLQIMDMTGRVLSRLYVRDLAIGIDELSAGSYLIEIKFSTRSFRKFFVKVTD